MSRVQVIVNPTAGRGHGLAVSPDIEASLSSLGLEYDLVHTDAPGHAVDLAQQAVAEGYDIIAAVGGDGTSNEVVNGLMASANGNGRPSATLACIPAGSGNDFAYANGMPEDIAQACEIIAEAKSRPVDLGRVTYDDKLTVWFDNTVGVGFDGYVSKETRLHTRVRGLALYVPVVLKTIFVNMHPLNATLDIDGEIVHSDALMLTTSNGIREGATFHIAPGAKLDDGLLNLLMVDNMSRLSMLGVLPKFMNGTHLAHPKCSERTVKHLTITAEEPMAVHMDGELPVDWANKIEIEMVPSAIDVISA